MSTVAEIAAFLLEHADLIEDIEKAITAGVTKNTLQKAIRDAMVAASDAEMTRELGGSP